MAFPRDPLPEAMQRVMGWIDEHFPAMSRKNKKNTLRSFLMAGIEPSRDFGPPRIDTLPSGQQFYRVRTAEARGWQRPSSMDTHGQAMLLRGGHGTTSNGLLGIMGEKGIRRGDYAGIYAQVTINGTDRDEVATAMNRVAKGTKNWSGVLIEVECHCQWESMKSGGIWGESEIVKKGVGVHNVNGARWVLPYQFLSLSALWFPFGGHLCDDLPGFDNPADE